MQDESRFQFRGPAGRLRCVTDCLLSALPACLRSTDRQAELCALRD